MSESEDLDVDESERKTTKPATATAAAPVGLADQDEGRSLERFANLRSLYDKMAAALQKKATRTRSLPSSSRSRSHRADEHPLHRAHHRAPVRRVRHRSTRPAATNARSRTLRRQGRHGRPHFHQELPGQRTDLDWLKNEIAAGRPTPPC